jgi:hypothetical protein
MEETLDFVKRLSLSVGCFYHLTPKGQMYSLKKYNSNERGRMGVFAWVIKSGRKSLKFRIDAIKDLADKAKVNHLVDGEKKNLNYNTPGYFFRVNKGSNGKDFQNAVNALRGIMSFR